MPDGPVVALVILVVGLAILGVVIYMVERRHAGRRKQTPARLPLFGTDQLSIRGLQGQADTDASEDIAPVSRPVPTRPRPQSPARPEPSHTDARPAPVARSQSARPETVRAERSTDDWHGAARASLATSPTPSPAAPPATPSPRPGDFAPRAPSVRPAATQVSATTTEEHPVRSAGPGPAERTPHLVAAPTGSESAFDAALVEGETLRFTVPTDGTVEFLPGHLEVVAGPDAGKEIRFVRALEDSEVEVTFGRSEGPPHRHIQILARTVSRRHAIMSLIDEHWQLTNLSSTNPVVLNGRLLAGNEVAPLLVEGDRIEMGEVVFVYHDA